MTKDTLAVPAPKPADVSLEQWLKARHAALGPSLLTLAAVFAAIPVWQFVRHLQKFPVNNPLWAWGAWLAALCLSGGLYLLLVTPERMAEGQYRLLALTLGGLAGLGTFAFGVALPLGVWSIFFIPVESTKDSSPLKLWKENWWRLIAVGLSVLGGLVLMFVSLQLARGVERASAGLRRLLYGYNAVLTGLLLFAILGLVNILAYVPMKPFSYLNEDLDWTPSQLHTLSEPTANLLKAMPGKVELFALMLPGRITNDLDQLARNCKKYNKNVTLKTMSPDVDQFEFLAEAQKYRPYFEGTKLSIRDFETGQIGLVVTYTSEDGKQDTAGIHYSDLVDMKAGPQGGAAQRYSFKGEAQLRRALKKLSERKPTKIYFTRGQGEYNLAEMRMPGSESELGALKTRLESRGYYEIKSVTPGVDSLTEADVLVIARPARAFSPKALDAIRSYVQPTGAAPKGKLIVLLDTAAQGGKMLETGLEPLLKEFNVEVSNARLLSDPRSRLKADYVQVVSNPDSKNPVAQAFGGKLMRYLFFMNARKVAPAPTGPKSILKAETLLRTSPGHRILETENLTAAARELVRAALEEKKPFEEDVPVAVAVSEGRPRDGLPPGHAPVDEQVARMVVFGEASWVSDEMIERSGNTAVDMFASCVSWLKGHVDLGVDTTAEKVRSEYTLKDKIQSRGQELRLIWLPLVLILLSIAALGGGIWVVRRR